MERTDVANEEAERMRQEMLSEEGFSQEEIDAAGEAGERFRRECDVPDNDARRALERYWGQFL